MNSSVRALAAVVLITLLVPLAWANGGRPPNLQPAKVIPEDMGKTLSSKKAQYVTTFDPKATRTRLVIPQKFVGGSAKDASKDAPKTTGSGSGNTLMAGLALSLGVVSGGVWWSRRGSGSLGKGKIVLLAIGVLGASVLAASALFADIAIPKDKGKGFPGPNPAFGMPRADIDIEITEKGDTVYLVIPGGGGGGGFGGGFGGPPPPGGGLVPPGGGFGPGNPNLLPKDAPPQPPLNPAPKKGGQEE